MNSRTSHDFWNGKVHKRMKVNSLSKIPRNFTGKVELANENFYWYKNGRLHREDGPAVNYKAGYNSWYLNDIFVWNTDCKLDFTNQIILSKKQHSFYPTVQVWKILGSNGLYEQIIVPGMEEYIQE